MGRHGDKREFTMLAHKYTPKKHSATGWFLSEKLDGERVFYDGGISRGMDTRDVPYANTIKDKKTVIATGLWTRGGKVVHAPPGFLKDLPEKVCLDGELWLGRGKFQELISIVRSENGTDEDWREVKYMLIDSPAMVAFATPGRIHDRDWETYFDFENWARERMDVRSIGWVYRDIYEKLKDFRSFNIDVIDQELLPVQTPLANKRIEERFREAVDGGAEGVMLRNPTSVWLPYRSNDLLKIKPQEDHEGTVVGYQSGKITNKGSRNLGAMGSLIVESDFEGKKVVHEVSGFTDFERQFRGVEAYKFAFEHPDEKMPDWVLNESFPIGTVVTYKYTELTKDGIPRHCNYWRVRK